MITRLGNDTFNDAERHAISLPFSLFSSHMRESAPFLSSSLENLETPNLAFRAVRARIVCIQSNVQIMIQSIIIARANAVPSAFGSAMASRSPHFGTTAELRTLRRRSFRFNVIRIDLSCLRNRS